MWCWWMFVCVFPFLRRVCIGIWTHRTWHMNDICWENNRLGTSLRARTEFVFWFAMLQTLSAYSWRFMMALLWKSFRVRVNSATTCLEFTQPCWKHGFMWTSPTWHALSYDSIGMCLMCCLRSVCFALRIMISWGYNQHGTQLLSRFDRSHFKRSPHMGAHALEA